MHGPSVQAAEPLPGTCGSCGLLLPEGLGLAVAPSPCGLFRYEKMAGMESLQNRTSVLNGLDSHSVIKTWLSKP